MEVSLYYLHNIINHVLFNFILNLYKRSVKKMYESCNKKTCFQRGFEFTKKNFIYKDLVFKEKSRAFTKVKLVT